MKAEAVGSVSLALTGASSLRREEFVISLFSAYCDAV